MLQLTSGRLCIAPPIECKLPEEKLFLFHPDEGRITLHGDTVIGKLRRGIIWVRAMTNRLRGFRQWQWIDEFR